jgi:hypothetical protein
MTFEGLSRGSNRSRLMLDGNPVYLARPIRRGRLRDAAPAFTVLRAGPAAMSFEGSVEALDQRGSGKRLGQEANCSGLERPGADALVREGRDENERRTATLDAHMRQQVQAGHSRHLHVRNHTRRVIQVGRPQELLGRRERLDRVAMRPQKIVGRGADRCIIVND